MAYTIPPPKPAPVPKQVPDSRKQSLYFPEIMLAEIKAEAIRQDRSLSWIVQRAWLLAGPTVKTYPAHDDLLTPAPTPSSPSGGNGL